MFARGQLDKAMFLAARDYERTYALAMALPLKTVDPSAPVVSGGGRGASGMVDAVRDAADRLRRMERRLSQRYGGEAVALCREVLGGGLTIERAAARRGDGDRQRVAWWGGMFRQSLRELAEVCGFAVRGAYANRRRDEARREAERERAEQKDREAQRAGQERRR